MSIAAKPDPIGIDASSLLEGHDDFYEEGRSTSARTRTPINARDQTFASAPPHPRKPPGSTIVGGCGIANLSKVWTNPTSAVTIVHSSEFTVFQRGMNCHLRFLVLDRPPMLATYITEEEWKDLRKKADEIGKRVIWDVNRSLILLVVIFFIIVVLNTGDDIGGTFALGDAQVSILIVLGVIFLKLFWDECYENYTRRVVFHEMDRLCQEFSNVMRPRGVCVAFRFFDNDDYGLLVDLVFYRVKTAEEAILTVA